MQRSTSNGKSKRLKYAIPIALMAVLVVSLSSVAGMADFSTTTTTQSTLGNKVVSDTSFTITNSGVVIATLTEAGAATGTSTQEIDTGVTLRTNTITSGNFMYKVALTEASALSSGTWTVKIYEDGTQVGDTITITQAVAIVGTTEGATILADLGSTQSSTRVYEVKITKTA